MNDPKGEGFGGVFGQDDVAGDQGAEGIQNARIGVLECGSGRRLRVME